jgi:CDGSH-type Zn-finger protein
MIWGNHSDKPFELRYEPSLGLIEDDALHTSGGLWVRGGIRIERENGTAYEVRNRVVLCRCGESANKPYCDGSHAALHWRDELEKEIESDEEEM